MTASLNTDATLRVELVECQFTKEARYSISLQLSLPGAAAVQERTKVAASSTQPTFKPSSFEFRLPAGLPLVGSPPVELTLSASTPELDTAAAEGVVPHGVTTAVGEAMLELGDTLRWELADVMGDVPEKRWRHTATLLPGECFSVTVPGQWLGDVLPTVRTANELLHRGTGHPST